MKKCAIIVAGGKGLRFGGEVPKQFRLLNGLPVLMHTINSFYSYDNSLKIVVVLPEIHIDYWNTLCKKYFYNTPHIVVSGGDTRWQSVKNGLSEIDNQSIVGIHDGVRPLVSDELIERVFEKANCCGAAIPAVKVTDSIRMLDNNGNSSSIDRERLRAVQTPQVFKSNLIKDAYNLPFEETFTDDASVAERYGIKVEIVEGDYNNIKITSAKDLAWAELIKKSV